MSRDPFLGFKLTQTVQPAESGKLDQRLFAPKTETKSKLPTPRSAPAPRREETPPKPVSQTRPIAKLESLTRDFDLAEQPLYKLSYLFTQPEIEALEDLQLELRRDLDIKVTKNDVIRSALHLMVQDYNTNGSASFLLRKTRKK